MAPGLNRFEAGWLKLFDDELPPLATPYRPSGVMLDVPEGTTKLLVSYVRPTIQFIDENGQSIGNRAVLGPGKAQRMQNR